MSNTGRGGLITDLINVGGQNLNNPVLKSYVYNKDHPGRFHVNDTQYYAGLWIKY